MGQFAFFPLSKFQYLPFLGIVAVFGHFCCFWAFLGVLRVPVSYKVTRGIIWDVGKVPEGVWGCFQGFWRGVGGSGGSS